MNQTEYDMKTKSTTRSTTEFWHIQIRSRGDIFKSRTAMFAFLNIWRVYLQDFAQTHAYCLLPGRIDVLVRCDENHDQASLAERISETLKLRLDGIWDEDQISIISGSLQVFPVQRDTDLTNLVFDIHTLAKKYGVTADYRTYPFSSYKALASSHPTLLPREIIWSWFGGRTRFLAFHQVYSEWYRPVG